MTWQWSALVGLALVALVLLLVLLVQVRHRRRIAAQVLLAREETAELRARLERLEAERQDLPRTPVETPATSATGLEPHHRITDVGEPAVRVEPAVFADQVLRESVIRLGALAHGVRRALDAETRNRIRFEMRREVKRARKQRRAEQREAYRDWQARRRADLTEDEMRESA